MRQRSLTRLILLLIVTLVSLPAVSKEMPVEHFFKNYEFNAVTLSPDGKHLAAIAPVGENRNLVVIDRATNKATAVTDLTDQDVAGYQWANHTRLVFYLEEDGNESFGISAVNLDGSKPRTLTKGSTGVTLIPRVTRMVDRLKEDDDHVLVSNNKRRAQFPDLYKLNIYTGRLTRITSNPGNIVGWAVDHDSKVRGAVAQTVSKDEKDVTYSILFRTTEDSDWKEVYQTRLGEEPVDFAGFTGDNKNVYLLSARGRDKKALYLFDPESGEMGDMIYAHELNDVDGPILSKKEHRLLGVYYTTDKQQTYYTDKAHETLMAAVNNALPDTINNIVSETEDEKLAVLLAWSDKTPGTYYLLEKNPLKLTFLASKAARFKADEMVDMKPIQYQARDGLTIHGYLTLPKNTKGPVPLIVNPHGGPYGPRDQWGFNVEHQFLANRGYGVLQMNFRGSGGYGHRFQNDAWKKWGLEMQDDITDGVKWAIKQGVADPKRICIYGGSYGGYAAMAGVTMTPELYKCAINYVGVVDLEMLHDWDTKSSHDRSGAIAAWFHKAVGDPDNAQDKARMDKTSPINMVANIQAPVMIVHGRRDPRVEIDQAEELMDKMDSLKKPYIKLIKTKEGHGFRKEENRLELYKMMDEFLKTHL